MRKASVAGVLAALAVGVALTGCSSGAADDDGLAIVASTNVWGDVARHVAGDDVAVTSIMDDPSADPHSYEASPRTELALSRADLVVANGGGYDDFVTTMLDALDDAPPVVVAVDASGHTDDDNEHVWYDVDGVRAVAQAIADELATLDPAHADDYAARAERFERRLDPVTDAIALIAAQHGGAPVATTEPVPAYLIQAAGLVDVTPPEFTEAIEDETDVPPAALEATLALFTSGATRALVYNEQTTGPQTTLVLAAAHENAVPVVPVTETLPKGEDYVSWMTDNVAALAEALA